MRASEQWRAVAGYEGHYEVSNLGRVYSIPRVDAGGVKRGGHLMRLFKDHHGYLYVDLRNGNKHKKVKVHRLVGFAFVPGYKDGLQINHKNEIKTDNRAENLEWVSPSQNVNHGTRNEKVSRKLFDGQRKTVQQIDLDGEVVAEYPNGASAARATGAQHTHIIGCCNGRAKTAGGYRWQYKAEQSVKGDAAQAPLFIYSRA